MKMQGIYAPYITQYLELKRRLGFKLRDIEYTFAQFDQLTIKRKEQSIGITKEFSDLWCEKRSNETDGTRYNRVSLLCLFARFLCDIGFLSYVPQVPKFKSSFAPHIFSKDEIASLFSASDNFAPDKITHGSSHIMMPVLFRLLYGTGLRLGEALALEEKDVNLEEKYVIVRQSKNGTERIVPMSGSLAGVCKSYRNLKGFTAARQIKSKLFFVKTDEGPCSNSTAYHSFRKALWMIGIPHRGKGLGPRLHDLRHTFACHSLAVMAEAGLDLYHSLPVLSTYLGHRTVESTNKYVRLTSEMYPNLLKNVSDLCAYVFPELKNEEQL